MYAFARCFLFSTQAAKQGISQAQFSLGFMYETGRGVMRSDEKAVQWYRKAAQQGEPKAQCNLGVMHDRGSGGVHQNDALATRYYRAAAEQGLADAQVGD